jgi:hydrogenase expression/formation protein HypE
VIVSGHIGNHGVAIMAHRNNLQFQTTIQSDTASLHELVACMVSAVPNIHCMRDPTRGGLASTLNELAVQSQVGFILEESKIPIQTEVASACELLGLDALYVANEGKLVAICSPNDRDRLLAVMRSHPLGRHAEVIGEVIEDPRHFVQLKTKLGGMRMVDWLAGEQLPRIC